MKLAQLLTTIIIFKFIKSTTLTYQVSSGETACFYKDVTNPPQKLSFYFAVQSGGEFDIDYSAISPSGVKMLDGTKERQGDFVFPANEVGEYQFCFINSGGGLKLVDFDIIVQNDQSSLKAELPSSSTKKEQIEQELIRPMEDTTYKLSATLADIARNQKHIRTRENRNMQTVSSTESRLIFYSALEMILIIGMSLMQVFVVRMFFRTTHYKGKI